MSKPKQFYQLVWRSFIFLSCFFMVQPLAAFAAEEKSDGDDWWYTNYDQQTVLQSDRGATSNASSASSSALPKSGNVENIFIMLGGGIFLVSASLGFKLLLENKPASSK